MAEPSPSRPSWRPLADLSGFTRADELPLLFWPVLWAGIWAGRDGLGWSHLLALILAVLLARAAAWTAFTPEAHRLSQIPRERRLLIGLFITGSLCFALPLGWVGLLVPAALLVAALWFTLRLRSYLSDPLLAALPLLLGVAAWLTQPVALSRIAGLLGLAIFLWSLAALVLTPVQRNGATLANLLGSRASSGVAALQISALVALGLAGHRAELGLCYWLGLGLAATMTSVRWWWAQKGAGVRVAPVVWEAGWGAAIFLGLACAIMLAPK